MKPIAPVLLVLVLGASLVAQAGPGFPNLVYPPNQLFTVVSTLGSGSHGHSILLRGYQMIARTGAGIEFYDVSNPYAPSLVQAIGGIGMDLSEPHTYGQTTAWDSLHVVFMRGPGGLGGSGIAIWDLKDIFNPVLESSYDLPGVPGGYASGLFWVFVQAPYIYCPVGSLGLIVVDATDPSSPFVANQIPKSALGGFNVVTAFAVGNMLIVTNSDSGTGIARLDISDPINPVLIDSTASTPVPYGAQVNGDAILIPAVSGCASCPGGNNGSFRVSKITDLAGSVNEIALPSRGASVVMQDGFAHIAASTAYLKVDITDPSFFPVIGTSPNNNSGGDYDWVTPIGNVVAMGDDQGGATQLIPHQSLPDNVGPSVTMVVPDRNETNQALTSRVGITVSDMVDTDSVNETSFFVRPIGGDRIDGRYSNQFGILNFTPDQPLSPGTTYEIVVPAGGLRDLAGNVAPQTFTSHFSTGAQVNPISVTVQAVPPTPVGSPVNVDVATSAGAGSLTYSWDFGDGSPPTPFSSASQASHTYATAGHYSVRCTMTDGVVTVTDSYIQTIHYPLTPNRPTRSSTIVLDEAAQRVWCVNADNDTVTAIGAQTLLKIFEVGVGSAPRTLARAPDGTVWVVCEDDATIHVLDPTSGANLATIPLRNASAPYGIAMAPNGSAAYVTLAATGEVVQLDPVSRQVRGSLPVGPEPRGIAISSDSRRIFVTRFVSPARGARIYELRAPSTEDPRLRRTLRLDNDPGPDTDSSGRGVPNYLVSAAISPDGRRIWIPSKKDNTARGQFRSGEALTFDNTVRTIVSQIDFATGREIPSARIDFNNRDMAIAITFSQHGDYAFTALQGSNAVDVRDAYSGDLVAAIEGTGLAPQGLVMSSQGTLFVHNFMSRSVSAYDTTGVTNATSFAIPLLGSASTVANEALATEVLVGKQIFYNAADPRMSEEGYISCASCHLDGRQDGRVWDFSDRGEGLRNTVSLRGRSGMGHGNVHWTANFDEIQDFENDIRFGFGGAGFMADALFQSGTVSDPLGQSKAGLSLELDALAAYVSSLTTVGVSPYRTPQGALSPAAQRGKVVFQQLNCAACHAGTSFTDSATGAIHDVGTLTPASGQAIGGPLAGLDTPTLRGLWRSAPYLHDGSARTLMDVLTVRNPLGMHGATHTLSKQDRQDLVAYLLQIDDLE